VSVESTTSRPPDFAIDQVALTFDLDVEHTEVEATLSLQVVPERRHVAWKRPLGASRQPHG
jgi:aminopeptidase N